MSERRYLIDNDVLSTIGSLRTSDRFLQYCWVPEEILFEAQHYIEEDFDKECVYRVTPAILDAIPEVMKALAESELQLVDIFKNEGNGDVLLLACAIDARGRFQRQLWPEWTIATEDKVLKQACDLFAIPTVSRDEIVSFLTGVPKMPIAD